MCVHKYVYLHINYFSGSENMSQWAVEKQQKQFSW